ncbi:possible Josephin [Prochlorococcus marinus str. MIT 9515]|uniref:Possible Josephin n=1 Tax=Prochlorococcus marinus (strain MIT 9515) TaxID=167542 RepID=A2BWV8_PROM5|nr:hypothetical protein [Prochlorococcus marinus]ABM72269.1 possible Josephin [Prochlorococcus marinus str. MIT 9515]
MQNKYLFLILASGVVNDQGFWLIGVKNSDSIILDDKSLLECHRKELIGVESAKDILNAINLNLDNLMSDLKKKKIPLDAPPKGISFNIPLNTLENIFDFWLDKYKDKQAWETCFGLLKIRRRVSLTNLINSESIKGDSKKWALEIEELHTYKPNLIKNDNSIDPMWK